MAISIDWGTKVITVPRADMLLVQSNPIEIRELDLNTFRLELKALENSAEGMIFPDTHRHNTTVTVSGITLARVIEMINGYTVTFEDGAYAVNLVGANSNVGDVVNLNSVSVRSANSAGLTYSKEIEDQSFLEGRVWIDTVNGLSGIQFPRGTHSSPVDNHADADGIVTNRNLAHRYMLRGTLVETGTADFMDEDWMGVSPTVASLQFSNAVNVTNCTFSRLSLSGDVSGPFTLEEGMIQNMTGFEGDCHITGFSGTITMPSGAALQARVLKDCYSLVPGTGTPIFDFNNATNIMWQFRGWSGGMELRNLTSSNNVLSIDLVSGHVKIDSSCTAGTIVIRGDGHITDNSGGAVNVVKQGLSTSNSDGILTKKEFIALK